MKRPLYGDASSEPRARSRGGNAGLWYDKFCDRWQVTGESWSMASNVDGNPKSGWIKSLVEGGGVGCSGQIDECALRLMRLVRSRHGRCEVFGTVARFVTGLGRSHPIENGFAWHPTLGTPYLPGSSIKGMVRAWARSSVEPSPDAETVARLLGSVGMAGSVSFLDAVPVVPVKLEADVITPHYAGWTEHDLPGDWRSPKPIPFLATAPNTAFLFGLVPVRTATDADLEIAIGWLRDALECAGGGARTALGYGRFQQDAEQTKRLENAVRDQTADLTPRQEARSPEEMLRLELAGLDEAGVLERVRLDLEKNRLSTVAERRLLAGAVPSKMMEHWRRGSRTEQRTNVGKKKLKERARLVDEALIEPD